MPHLPGEPIPASDMDPRTAEPMPDTSPAQHDGHEQEDSVRNDPPDPAHPHGT